MFITLAYKSLKNRKGSVLLSLLAMMVSTVVLLGVEHIRGQAKESFANTVSGVDLIVGSRTSSLNLLLYSVFRVGAATNNIDWESYQHIAAHSKIDWAVPITLGDSHRGYPVMGTTDDYFDYFKYGNAHALAFTQGRPFNALFDVVVGAEVARQLGYQLGDKLVLAHGVAETSFTLHENQPFTVVGILAATGTPIDQTLHISLQGIETVHAKEHEVVHAAQQTPASAEQHFQPKQVTAVLLGLKSRLSTFTVQRSINEYNKEPLIAILPGVALTELWQIMGILEDTLRLVSMLILISALLGLSAMLLASLREREYEIQLLRAIGASPLYLFSLIQIEALLISATGFAAGCALLTGGLLMAQDSIAAQFGVHISASVFSQHTVLILLLILIATAVVASIPSFHAYRNAKHL